MGPNGSRRDETSCSAFNRVGVGAGWRLYRFARHARFVDGADEVHREMVARHALRAYSTPDSGVPSEHIPTRRAAALHKFEHVLAPASVE